MSDQSMRLPSLSAAHPVGPPPPGPVQPPGWLAGITIALIAAGTVIQLITQAVDVLWFEALEGAAQEAGASGRGDALDRVDLIEIFAAILGMASSLVLLLTGVCFIAWLHRARTNLEILGISGFKRSRGWVIGSWFIPFANLVLPFGMVAEVARASDPSFELSQPASDSRDNEPLLVFWWAGWIAMSIVSQVYNRVYLSAGDVDQTPASLLDSRPAVLVTGWLTTILTVIAAILATLVVLRITRRQQARIAAAARPPFGGVAMAWPVQ